MSNAIGPKLCQRYNSNEVDMLMAKTTNARTTRVRRTIAATAAAATVAGAAALSLPATASAQALPPPEPPVLTATLVDNDLTLELDDPNRGLAQALTVCTAALLNAEKAIPLLPDIAAGTIPPLDQIDPALFQWGPSLEVTSALVRKRTYQVDDIPPGVYVALGVCVNPNITQPALDFKPVLVGSKIELGSSVLNIGSAVIDTPGAFSAILTLLGIDTGSLGSAGSGDGGSTGSTGSAGS
ncbi:hypothetical protein [Rhodococcus kronopolitis]|uniref:Secreted protein n=1 Tax=Rhodococcus kronopolitis TaxID=1460226 RepID=A0ABV9FTX7_9NOCA